MFTTVRYFIKTSIVFLIIGILSGLFMSFSRYVFKAGYYPEIITAHTHIILAGSVLMMIMGVALWFFPKAEKEDKKYNPMLIYLTYWAMTFTTLIRFVFQIMKGFYYYDWISIGITIASTFQVLAIGLFFYSMWGRIRPVRMQYIKSKGENL
jgi:hypothetical protein